MNAARAPRNDSIARREHDRYQQLKESQPHVDRYLSQGKMFFVSSQPVSVARDEVNPEVMRAIVTGHWVDMQDVTLPNGVVIRVGRTKGQTYALGPNKTPGYYRGLRAERKARWAEVSPGRTQ